MPKKLYLYLSYDGQTDKQTKRQTEFPLVEWKLTNIISRLEGGLAGTGQGVRNSAKLKSQLLAKTKRVEEGWESGPASKDPFSVQIFI